MAKKMETVSLNSQETLNNKTAFAYEPFECGGLTIMIRQNIPLADLVGLVKEVVDGVTAENGEVRYELVPFATDVAILRRFTNLRIAEKPEKEWELLCETGIGEFCRSCLKPETVQAINEAISMRLEDRSEVHKARVEREIEDMRREFKEMSDSIQSMFSDVKPAEFKAFVKAMGSGTFDEKKLVDALIETGAIDIEPRGTGEAIPK